MYILQGFPLTIAVPYVESVPPSVPDDRCWTVTDPRSLRAPGDIPGGRHGRPADRHHLRQPRPLALPLRLQQDRPDQHRGGGPAGAAAQLGGGQVSGELDAYPPAAGGRTEGGCTQSVAGVQSATTTQSAAPPPALPAVIKEGSLMPDHCLHMAA